MRRGDVAIAAALLACTAGTAACGKKTQPASIDDGVCDDLFDAIVASGNQCGAGPFIAGALGPAYGGPSGSLQADPSQKDVFVEYYCHVLAAAPGTGTLADQLRACTTALQGATPCASMSGAACTAIGTLPPGSPCGSSAQCASGSCGETAPPAEDAGTEEGCGTCLPAVDDGDPCNVPDADVACAQGSQCGGVGTSADGGFELVCAAYAQPGAACASSCSPEPCAPPMCTPGFTCDSQALTCQPVPPLLTEGQPCDMFGCAPGLMCGGATGGGPADAASGSVCVKAPVVEQGQTCVVGATPIDCDVGLQCQDGVCQPVPGVGSACTPHAAECPFPLLCRGGSCQQPDIAACGG